MTLQDEKDHYLAALLSRPIFPHERTQWLAEIEHHARMAGVNVTVHDVNLTDNSHHTTMIEAETLAPAIQTR